MISAIIRALTMNIARPKPPVDPYARGSVVPPMKTAQKVSAEQAEQTLGKPGCPVGTASSLAGI